MKRSLPSIALVFLCFGIVVSQTELKTSQSTLSDLLRGEATFLSRMHRHLQHAGPGRAHSRDHRSRCRVGGFDGRFRIDKQTTFSWGTAFYAGYNDDLNRNGSVRSPGGSSLGCGEMYECFYQALVPVPAQFLRGFTHRRRVHAKTQRSLKPATLLCAFA
jgi:hypothetical protein